MAKKGIAVNAFRPGIVETDMWACNDAAWGEPLDTDAAYITGQIVNLDGSLIMP